MKKSVYLIINKLNVLLHYILQKVYVYLKNKVQLLKYLIIFMMKKINQNHFFNLLLNNNNNLLKQFGMNE